ncbi:flagellar protein FlaG [Oceanisphaera ostreae]|uniref:Flagellar protein FlaG n=1 Tax=Oceanisphaera ostreae TaxID=914151 RepID=A0ABW3KD56_9GAMM
MDTLPLPPKAPMLASDLLTKQPAATTQPAGSSATQTAQAVQAADKTNANHLKPSEHVAEPLTAEQLAELAEQMDSFVGSFNQQLKFRVDEDSGRHVVSVVDKKNGDIIRQIPTEELLEVIARLAEASTGLLDAKA